MNSKSTRSLFGQLIDKWAHVEKREARAVNSTPAVRAATADVVAREQKTIDEYYQKQREETGVVFSGYDIDPAYYGDMIINRGRPEEILRAAEAGVRVLDQDDPQHGRRSERLLRKVRNELSTTSMMNPDLAAWTQERQTAWVNAALKCGVVFDERAQNIYLSPYKLVADGVGVRIVLPSENGMSQAA